VENLILTGADDIDGTGNEAANAITGNDGDNVLSGLGGDDILDGGAGTDTASYAGDTAGVMADLSSGFAVGAAAGTDTLVSIENVVGGAGDDVIVGTAGANVLSGGAGDDTLTGGAGDDVLIGGEGVDTVTIAGAYDAGSLAYDAGNGVWILTTAD